MRFVFGYAGIPSEIYDDVYAKRDRICGDSGQFISEPLHSRDRYFKYSESHSNFFLRRFARIIREDNNNNTKDTGFVLIYVRHEEINTVNFVRCFFPSTLCLGIDWALDRRSSMTIRQSKNKLIEALKLGSDETKKAIPSLKKEITERDNRTPLLLPIKNFVSTQLVKEIQILQNRLIDVEDKPKVVTNAVRVLERYHPMQAPERGFRRFFVDDRNVQFHPPGTNRHAFARAEGGHPETCLLSGRRRLGAPYDRTFHYDCQKGAGNIRELFYGCHEDRTMKEGDPHLNIAPNDNVRT